MSSVGCIVKSKMGWLQGGGKWLNFYWILNMSKVLEIHLEWKYTPSNYLEEPIEILNPGLSLKIFNGIAIAHIEPETFEKNSSISGELTRLIENRLYAVQISTHKNFSLSKPSRSDLREDGKRNIFIEVQCLVIGCSLGIPDIVMTDKDGNIISDTRQERIDKQKWFAEMADRYRDADSTLDHILKSYQKSVIDQEDEFVHLYEIRDTLSAKFGGENNAKKELEITNNEWKVIGVLANNSPLKQGRHRGKSVGSLRAAEPSELEVARKSASLLIEKYLIFLGKPAKKLPRPFTYFSC